MTRFLGVGLGRGGRLLRIGAGGAAAALLALSASVGSAAADNGLPYPLPSGSQYIFTTPNPPQTNSFVTSPGYWSVVGILPPPGSSYSLAVSDSAGNPLATAQSPTSFDWQFGYPLRFVAVNSNWGYAPAGTDTARTSVLSGSGSYGMEFSNPRRFLSSASPGQRQYEQMGPGEFITTSDVWLNSGQVYSFYVSGCAWGCFGESLLMPSNVSVAGASQALWQAFFNWGGSSDMLNWTAPQSGWYALITIEINRASNDIPYVVINGPVTIP